MNPNLQLAKETMNRLRKRRCVQRVVVLRLTVSESKLLSDVVAATVRECDDTQANRATILLCDKLRVKLQKQIEREQHNDGTQRPPT